MALARLPWRAGVAQCVHRRPWAAQGGSAVGAATLDAPLLLRRALARAGLFSTRPSSTSFSSGRRTPPTPPHAAHYVSGPDPTASFDAILDDEEEDMPDFDWARGPSSTSAARASSSGDAHAPDARDVGRAVALAAAALARRPHGRDELEAKLVSRHGLARQVAAAGVARLVALGLQSDAEFAASFARGKWRAAAWAPRRIAAELGRRGVGPAPIAAALEGLFGYASPRLDTAIREAQAGEEEGAAGAAASTPPSSSSAYATPAPGDEWLAEADRGTPADAAPAHLLASAARQAALSKGLPPPARRRRLVGWLQRRGHSWGTVAAVLDALAL
jgi:hypothetical protein